MNMCVKTRVGIFKKKSLQYLEITVLFIIILLFILAACNKNKKSADESGKINYEDEISVVRDADDLLLVESESIKIFVTDVIEDINKKMSAGHGQMGKGSQSLEDMIQDVLKEKINKYYVYNDAKQKGFLESDKGRIDLAYYIGLSKQEDIEKKIYEKVMSMISDEEVERGIPRRLEKIKLRQILVSTEDEAKKILEKAKAGEDFIELVKEYSMGPSMYNIGITDEMMVDSGFFSNYEDEEAAFELSEGELYDGIIKSPLGGFLVYKVEEKIVLDEKEKDDYKKNILENVYKWKLAKYFKVLTEKYKENTKINEPNLSDAIEAEMKGEDGSDFEIATFKGIKISYSNLKWAAPQATSKGEIMGFSLMNNFLIIKRNLDNFMSILLKQECFPEVKVPDKDKNKVRNILIGRIANDYLEEKLKNVTVSDEELKEFYEKNIDQYTRREKVEAYVMFLPTQEDAALALDRYKKGESFEYLCKELSIDEKTRASEGYLGWIWSDSDRVPEDILNVMFSIKVGKVSDPIETEAGYVILWVKDKKDSLVVSFEDSLKWTKKNALASKLQFERSKYFSELKSDDKIIIHDENVEKMIEKIRKSISDKSNGMNMPIGH